MITIQTLNLGDLISKFVIRYFSFIGVTLLCFIISGILGWLSQPNSTFAFSWGETFFGIIINLFPITIVYVLVLKIYSLLINEFIFESNLLNVFVAFVFVFTKYFTIMFFKPINPFNFQFSLETAMIWIDLLIWPIIIYYFWKYRYEIASGIFFMQILVLIIDSVNRASGELSLLEKIVGTRDISPIQYSGIFLGFWILYIALSIILRKKFGFLVSKIKVDPSKVEVDEE